MVSFIEFIFAWRCVSIVVKSFNRLLDGLLENIRVNGYGGLSEVKG